MQGVILSRHVGSADPAGVRHSDRQSEDMTADVLTGFRKSASLQKFALAANQMTKEDCHEERFNGPLS